MLCIASVNLHMGARLLFTAGNLNNFSTASLPSPLCACMICSCSCLQHLLQACRLGLANVAQSCVLCLPSP